MNTFAKPAMRPARPNFSSGPCAKRPGWNPDNLRSAVLGRSHRSSAGKARLKAVIDQTRALLEIPHDYLISDHRRAPTPARWKWRCGRCWVQGQSSCWPSRSFGKDWVTDVVKQLKLDAEVLDAPYGRLPDLSRVRGDADLVFTWNGTTSGVRVPNADFIAAKRAGLTICDATSACFAQALDWAKLDVTTFSWQKALGGEGAHGVLILSPRAVERLETHTPAWPMPKLFRMTKAGKLNAEIFEGATINTPSMLCVEDFLDALRWAASAGGLAELRARADANLAVLETWVAKTPWVDFLAEAAACRSNTSVCLKVVDPAVTGLAAEGQGAFAKRLAQILDKEGVALDIGGYRDAPPGLRIWCGATVERDDVEALTPWLDWAFAETSAELTPA